MIPALVPVLLPILLGAALRALLAGIAVWLGLRLLRIGNILAQKAAWGLVLAGALAIPLLMPLAARRQWVPDYAAVRLPAIDWNELAGHRPSERIASSGQTEAAAASMSPRPTST